jgi:hypothetical protein
MAEPIWYYAIDDQEHGPVTPAELKEVARSGQLLPTDLVWKQGLDDWKPARHVAGLFASAGKSSIAKATGNGQNQADTTDDLSHKAAAAEQEGTAAVPGPTPPETKASVEQPPEALLDSPPQAPPEAPLFEEDREPITAEPNTPAFEAPQIQSADPVEPPAPPPMGRHLPTGVPYSGEYRLQERVRRSGVTVGPVTLRLARLLIVVALLSLLMLQGCQSISASYVERLQAVSVGAQQEFLAQWDDRRSELTERRLTLQADTNRNTVEATELGRILDDLETIDEEMVAERAQLEDTTWLTLKIDAGRAEAEHGQWVWWLQMVRLPLMFLLAGGALVLGFFSEAHDRWLGIGLVVVVAVYALALV